MKQEAGGKKSKLWLWIVIAVAAVLAIAGVVLAMVLGGQDKDPDAGKTPEKIESDLYWNLDRLSVVDKETGLSIREAGEDGLYHIRFAVGGQQVEYSVADKKLVNRIDMLDVVCLKFDEEGSIIDMVAPEELYVKLADKFFVQDVNGSSVTLNSSQALNGMAMPITLGADTGVYNVDTKEEVIGAADEMEPMDQVIAFGDEAGNVDTVFIISRPWASEVYWRVGQMYDSAAKASTRKQADDGYWYFTMAVNGEHKQLRTNDVTVINAIDGYNVNAACCGLVFDENGDVIDCFSAALAVRGSVKANGYDITAMSDSSFTAERLLTGTEVGKTYTGNITADTKIFNVNSTAQMIGQVDKLQVGDRVYVLANTKNEPVVIYIINRMVDSPLYYNVSRNYSTGLGRSQRTPDANGWYNIQLAVGGQLKTYRTKDFELVNQLDAYAMSLFGLKLNGDIIVDVYDAVCVTGNYSFASNYFVTGINGPVLSCQSISGTAANGVMTADCEIYDMSGNGKFKGEKTQLRVGDRVICYKNIKDEIVYICVVNRYEEGTELYWNVTRKYANGATSRTTDENGYYVFDVIKVGTTKVTQLKTKSKDVASAIDKQSTPTAFAARVKGGVVSAAYGPASAIGGYMTLNYTNVEMQNPDGTFLCCARSTGATGTLRPAADMKVYNFSGVYDKAKGETTNLKFDDKISCIANTEGKVAVIFVIERETDTKIYFNKTRKYNTTKAETTRTADAEGYYVFELAVDGQVKQFKTKSKELATQVDSYALAFGLKTKGDIIEQVYPVNSARTVKGSAAGSYYDVEKISGKTVTLKRNRPDQTDTGKTVEITLASNYKVYNMAPGAGDKWGKADKLQVGDRIHAYTNNDGDVWLIYIMYACTREGGPRGMCAHCGKTVWWEQWGTGAAYKEDVHYYVGYDMERNSNLNLSAVDPAGEGFEYVLDLNGHTITRIATNGGGSSACIGVASNNTLLITDYSGKVGTVRTDPAGITYSSATSLIICSEGANMIIEKGNFDASSATSKYAAAASGPIAVGGKVTINGGTFKGFGAFKGSGGVIGGWSTSEITINGGTFYTGGGILNPETNKVQGNGGVIATTGKLTINGGEFIGQGADQNIRTFSGGLIQSTGAELTINGGKIYDGRGEGYGFNIYYEKNNGLFTIGSGANIGGGVTMRSNKADKPAKLVVHNGAYVDCAQETTGATINLRLENVDVYFNSSTTAVKEVDAISNWSLQKNCQGKLVQLASGGTAEVVHNFGSDEVCDDCGFDRSAVRDWTDPKKLPTSGNWRLAADVTVTTGVRLNGNLYLDLNGHTITNTGVNAAFDTNYNDMRVTDLSGKAQPGTIKTVPAGGKTIQQVASVLYVAPGDTLTVDNGIIDGSAVTNTYTTANGGTIGVANTSANGGMYGTVIINGGVIKGQKSAKASAIGGMGMTTVVINGGEIIGNAEATSATVVVAGHLTVAGGKIHGGYNGQNVSFDRAQADLVLSGGEIDGGVNVGAANSVTLSGDLKINPGAAYGLKLKSGAKADVSGLTEDAKVYVDASGVFTKDLADEAAAQKLIDDEILVCGDDTMELTVSGSAVKMAVPVAEPEDPDEIVWTEWTADNSLPTSGSIKLTKDVALTEDVELSDTLNIDLNGFNITRTVATGNTTEQYVFALKGNAMLITDLSGKETEGTVKVVYQTASETCKSSAGVILVSEGSVLTVDGGIIDGSNITSAFATGNSGTISAGGKVIVNGGIIRGIRNTTGASGYSGGCIGGWSTSEIVINGGQLVALQTTGDTDYVVTTGGCISTTGSIEIHGGVLLGGKAKNHGGAIYSTGNITMTGGTILGGTAGANGGNICANGGAVMTITGGTILGGDARGTYGDNIDKVGGVLTVGGDAVIGGGVGIRSNAKLVLTGKAIIDPSMTANGVYDIMPSSAGGIFLNDTTGTALATANGKYLVCYGEDGAITGVKGTKSKSDWTETTSLPTSGYYKLTANVELTGLVTVADSLRLDLNGFNITRTVANDTASNQHVFHVGKGKTLSLVDHSGKQTLGSVKVVYEDPTETSNGAAGVIYGDNYSIVRIENVTIDASSVADSTYANAGGAILAGNYAKLDIINATVKGYKHTTGCGTAIGAWGNSVVTVSGDKTQIIGGNAESTTSGRGEGGVISANGEWTIEGGTFSVYEGTGSTKHGAIIGMKGGSLTINGGTFKGNTATANGGIINANSATLTINGGTFQGGKAALGGQIYGIGKITVTGGTFTGSGVSHSGSGGLICSKGTELTITGGTFIKGAASGYGTSIYYDRTSAGSGVFTLGGEANVNGGITVRAKAGTNAKLVVADSAMVDNTGATPKPGWNLRLVNVDVFVNDGQSAALTAGNSNTDISLTHDCAGLVTGVVAGTSAGNAAHVYASGVCTGCGAAEPTA